MAKEEKTLDEMFQELDKLIQAMEETGSISGRFFSDVSSRH